jgi:hypothetical protein
MAPHEKGHAPGEGVARNCDQLGGLIESELNSSLKSRQASNILRGDLRNLPDNYAPLIFRQLLQ